jgi:hypothetical protein
MSIRATAQYELTGWDQTPYDGAPGGPALGQAIVGKRFSGDLEGESTARLLLCQADPDDDASAAGYVGSEQFTGRLAGRSGSFVVQHGATRDGTKAETFGYVVPGSGTGELEGLTGQARFRHDAAGAVLTLEYDLP